MIVLEVESVTTTCGFAVPRYDYVGERDKLNDYAREKGEAGMAAYRRKHNRTSIDGLPTHLFE